MSILRSSCLGVLAVLATGALLTACSGDDQAEVERAQREEIRDERREAARAARQDERIKQLEREAAAAKRRQGGGQPPPTTTTDTGTHVSTGADSWPEGTTAWTVVLASTGARGEAEAVATRAGSANLGQVGVLFSSNYSSLHDGYWVAYTGVLSQTDARARQAEARAAGFGDAYAREVSP
jgi:hypothetical protein